MHFWTRIDSLLTHAKNIKEHMQKLFDSKWKHTLESSFNKYIHVRARAHTKIYIYIGDFLNYMQIYF
jgi:hypothetical protein